VKKGVTEPAASKESFLQSSYQSSATDGQDSPSNISLLCLEAYVQQSKHLGWEIFLRGRISKKWGESFLQESMYRHRRVDKAAWTSRVINLILQYSSSLWHFRCSLLHGKTVDESKQKLLQRLRESIETAYVAYSADPFVVDNGTRSIFLVPLAQRLTQDPDSLQCFLRSYEIARSRQELLREVQVKSAAQFFFPTSLPTIISFSTAADSSIVSDCTISLDGARQPDRTVMECEDSQSRLSVSSLLLDIQSDVHSVSGLDGSTSSGGTTTAA
jgi:hypothetical protein